MHISELTPGQNVQGWMRLGLPLMLAVDGHGSPYRLVPWRSTSPRPCDLTKFVGLVVANSPERRVIQLNVQGTYKRGQPNSEEALRADIPYMALQILRVLSPAHFPAKHHNSPHPTNVQSQYVPYRTSINVDLF